MAIVNRLVYEPTAPMMITYLSALIFFLCSIIVLRYGQWDKEVSVSWRARIERQNTVHGLQAAY